MLCRGRPFPKKSKALSEKKRRFQHRFRENQATFGRPSVSDIYRVVHRAAVISTHAGGVAGIGEYLMVVQRILQLLLFTLQGDDADSLLRYLRHHVQFVGDVALLKGGRGALIELSFVGRRLKIRIPQGSM